MRLRFPRDQGPNRSPVNVRHLNRRTAGERVADAVAAGVGSWPFIITQSAMFVLWVLANAFIISDWLGGRPFDPYPFILLNLTLSFQAAYTGPVVMMSQNRQAAKDRDAAEHDYRINQETFERLKRLEGMLVEVRDLQRHQG